MTPKRNIHANIPRSFCCCWWWCCWQPGRGDLRQKLRARRQRLRQINPWCPSDVVFDRPPIPAIRIQSAWLRPVRRTTETRFTLASWDRPSRCSATTIWRHHIPGCHVMDYSDLSKLHWSFFLKFTKAFKILFWPPGTSGCAFGPA